MSGETVAASDLQDIRKACDKLVSELKIALNISDNNDSKEESKTPLKSVKSPLTPKIDMGKLMAVVDQMEELLRDSDTTIEEVFETNKGLLREVFGNKIINLEGAIAEWDMDEALKALLILKASQVMVKAG